MTYEPVKHQLCIQCMELHFIRDTHMNKTDTGPVPDRDITVLAEI